MKDIKIGSFNVRGLNKNHKRKEIFHYLEKNRFDVICIQETKIRSNEIKYLKNPKLGNIFYSSDEKKRRRGVAIYINKNYEAKEIFKVKKVGMSQLKLI